MRLFFTSKLIFFITLPIVIFSTFILIHIENRLEEKGMEQLKSHMLELVQHYASNISSQLDKASAITNTTALFISTASVQSEENHYKILRNNLSQNRVIYGSAIAYEPNYYKNKRLYAPYVFRGKESIQELEIAKDSYNYTKPKWSWYASPKNQLSDVWSEPYFDEGAGNTLMITYSVPIMDNNKFSGVVTVDLDLTKLQETLELEDIKDSDYVILTNTGHFAYHTNKELIGKSFLNLADDLGLKKSIFIARRMITGERGFFEIGGSSKDLKGDSLVFFAPVGKYGWSFALAISKKNAQDIIYYDRDRMLMWLFAIFTLGLLLTIYVSIYSFTKPMQLLNDGLVKLSTGDKSGLLKSHKFGIFSNVTKNIISIFTTLMNNQLKSNNEIDQLKESIHEKITLLSNSEKRLSGLLSSAQNSVVIINKLGEIVATNQKSETILKLKMQNMLGEHILSFIDKKDKNIFTKVLNKLFSSIEPQELEDITIITKNNVRHRVKAIIKPVFISDEEIEANLVFIKVNDD